MNILYAFIALIAVLYAVYKYKNRPVTEVDIPTPTVWRRDLKYTYYGCETSPDVNGRAQNQPAETFDHVNLFWEAQFNPLEDTIKHMRYMAMPTVLDVAWNCMNRTTTAGRSFFCREDAPQHLRFLFNSLQQADVLQYVKVLVPMDEPNTQTTEAELKKAINAIRLVAREYPELKDVKLACIYAAMPETYDCIEEFDYVGVDDYDRKNTILVGDGAYQKLKAKMLPYQKSILLPGGAFGQNPTPFVNFAHSNPEVWAVVPFCWFGRREEADTWVGIGDPANGRQQQYIDAGRAICHLGGL